MSHAYDLDIPPVMTAAQFCDWPGDGTGRRFQLIDGDPVAMAPPSHAHGILIMRLGQVLQNDLDRHPGGYRVTTGTGVQPRLGAATNVRVPGLSVSCSPASSHLMQTPVFIAEILSPSNAAETREAVRACLTIPSLREVLILSATRPRAEITRRGRDGHWPEEATILGEEDELLIECFDFRTPLRALYPAS